MAALQGAKLRWRRAGSFALRTNSRTTKPPSRSQPRDGGGDFEDLAAYLAAYLVFKKVKPVGLIVRWALTPTGGRLFHILVKGPKGPEDPSKKLGMGKEGTS